MCLFALVGRSAPAGSVINEQALSAPPVSWSRAIGGQPLYGAGLSNGRFTCYNPIFLPPRLAGNFHWAINRVRSIYKASACCIWRWQSRNHSNFPLLPLPMIAACWWGNSPAGQQITTLGAVPATVDQLLLAPDGRLLYVLSGNQVHIYQLVNRPLESENLRVTHQVPAGSYAKWCLWWVKGSAQWAFNALLIGWKSLLVQSPDGVVTQWFDVRKGPSPSFHLTRIRSFTPASQGILTAENTRRVFALLSPHGELSLFQHPVTAVTAIYVGRRYQPCRFFAVGR